jgi:hypothetical protein
LSVRPGNSTIRFAYSVMLGLMPEQIIYIPDHQAWNKTS